MTVWPGIVNELQDRYEPASESDILAFEAQIGHKLPEDYRNFLKQFHAAGFGHRVECDVKEKCDWLDFCSPDQFFGLVPDKENNILHQLEIFKGRIPAESVPICDNSGDVICLGISGRFTDRVWLWHRTCEQRKSNIHLVADSFFEFLNTIQVQSDRFDPLIETMPLFSSIETGDISAVRNYLLEGGDVSTENELGDSLLHAAVRWRWPDLVKLLLENGADPDARDRDGDTALWISLRAGTFDIFKALLEAGANSDLPDPSGMQLLQYASTMYARERFARYLESFQR